MAFLIGGANSAADTGYNIANSLRIEKGDSAYLSDALSSPNTDIFTISMWLKIIYNDANTTFCEIGKTLTGEAGDNTTFNPHIGYGRIAFNAYDGVANAYRLRWGAPGEFRYRDSAAWYHVVMRLDSSQGVAASRARFYVNGEDISSLLTHTTDPSQNDDYFNATGSSIYFGGGGIGGGGYWDGYMADVAYIDGTSYAPSTFGETDEDSGIWKPKDFKSDVTFGTNGLYLEFKQSGTGTNASGLGADTSGNDNHMAATNLAATDQTTDTPTNNFATANPLWIAQNANNSPTYSEGNTVVTSADDNANDNWISTIGLSKGKWYVEAKGTASDPDISLGFHLHTTSSTNGLQNLYGFYTDGDKAVIDGSPSGSAFGSTSQDDIIGMALDLDNTAIYFHRQGTYLDSGDPTSGASKTGAIITSGLADEGVIGGHAYNGVAQLNFGNPSFAISSGNADANGYGNFEYAVPSGYFSLCSKNLAEHG